MLDLDGIIDRTRNAFTETVAPFLGDAVIQMSYINTSNDSIQVKYFDTDDDTPVSYNTRSALAGYANVYADTEITAPRYYSRVKISLVPTFRSVDLSARDHLMGCSRMAGPQTI